MGAGVDELRVHPHEADEGDLVELGANNFMWASDYPHPDSTFPNSAHAIAEAFGHLDAAFGDRVTRINCVTLYRFAA